MRVLWIDDDPQAPTPFAFKLERRGHVVRLLDDPVDAWDTYLSFQPDVLILDLVFLASTVRYGLMIYHDIQSALWRQGRLIARTIVVSALDTPEERAEVERAGVDLFLLKPLSVESFLAAFETVTTRIDRERRPHLTVIEGRG